MAFLGIENGTEVIFDLSNDRAQCPGNCKTKYNFIELPAGSIKKLTGKEPKTGMMPIELK